MLKLFWSIIYQIGNFRKPSFALDTLKEEFWVILKMQEMFCWLQIMSQMVMVENLASIAL